MKKFFSMAMMVALCGWVLTSCGGDSTETNGGDSGSSDTVTAPSHNSEYYNDIVFAEGGDFVGISIGDSKESVKSNLPSEAFADETDGYVYYEWVLDNNDYYLDLYFDDNDKLSSIDGYVYFYDKDDYYDKAAAKDFYKDMTELFGDKYGSAEEENDGEYIYSYWYMDEMDAEVGLDEGEVYWYLYGYEDEM